MKIFNKFIWSKKEPSNKNDIWFDGSTWKVYTEEAWQSFTLSVDDADKVAKVLENASEVYQEKLNAGYGIVIEGNTISLDVSSIDINTTYNIGSIEIFDDVISSQNIYYLTTEDIEAIRGGKLITTTYGDLTIPAFGVSGGGSIIHIYFYVESKLYDIGIVDDGFTPGIFPHFCKKVDILLYKDDFLSEISENSVQNKVITAELNKKLNKTDVATINGQSLTEGGNIIIPTGGESYDDTEIKQQITELFGRSDELLSDLGKKIDRVTAMEYIEDLQAKDTQHDAKLAELSEEINEVAEKINNINPTPMISVTYAELVVLRDNGELVAGMQYRITDYVTTTAQENTRSAGHQFDVIVTADNENTLNEVARACLHEGDTYFSEAGANLAAWHIWYSLDNDTERFAWAIDFAFFREGLIFTWNGNDYDSSGSLMYEWEASDGCIVYTKTLTPQVGESVYDDVGEEDGIVENIINGKGVIYRMIDEWNNDLPYDFKNIQFMRNLNFDEGFAQFSEDGEETWVYTFAGQSYHINNDEWSDMLDGSLESPFGHMSDEKTSTFHDNTIKPYIMVYNGNDIYAECGIRYLNDIVFLGYWEKIGSSNDEDMPYYYAYCCFSNSFGNDCGNNSFGKCCYGNSFGNNCYGNSFGNYCGNNSFGDECSYNSFGNFCRSNSFGDECSNNSFGNNCYGNSFGNYCYGNSFKDSDGIADNVEYNKLDDGVHNIELYYDDNNGSYGELKNHHVCRGCNNTAIEIYQNREYETIYARIPGGLIKEVILAELKAS